MARPLPRLRCSGAIDLRMLAGIVLGRPGPEAAGTGWFVAMEDGKGDVFPAGGSIDPSREQSPHRDRHRVLVVEDDSHVGHLFRRLLQRMYCRVHLETSAPPALQRIHSGERYELVISDIVLPGEMDGVDLLAAIRRRDPEQPVMLTTGYDRHALRDLPDELEGVDLLRKPFRRQDLEVLVGPLLA